MAKVLYATNRYPGDGTTTTFTVAFLGGYISRDHVKAFVTSAEGVDTDIALTPSMWVNATTLDLGQPVPVGSILTLKRDTPKVEPLVDYENGTRLTAGNMDLANRQNLFAAAEAHDLLDIDEVSEVLRVFVTAAQGHADAAATSADFALTNAGLAADEASAAQASADAAEAARIASEQARTESQNSADDSAASAATSQAIATALAGGSIGFDAVAYDFGYVADAFTYFNRDFGSLT
jgi:hypothetical protein